MNDPRQNPVWLEGSCTCGTVRFRVLDDFDYAQNCHCSQCRKATGSAFKPFGGIAAEKLDQVSGGDSLLHIGGPIDHDVRCAMCGAFLYSVVQSGKRVHVAFGSLEGRPSRLPDAHIFVGSKADWFEINDELPQHEGFP